MAYVTPQQYGFSIPGGIHNPMFNSGSWTMPAGGWNNQNAPRPENLGVDALNAMAGQPGAAAQHYGFSTDANSPYYILGDRYLGKLQADWSKGITTGGNKQIHKILTGLGDSYGSKQAFVKADPNLGAKFAQYFKTGDAAAAGLTPARAKQAYDYALRATGRDAVLDRSPGLLGGLLKGNIGALIGTVGGFALGGPLGAKIGGTLGGTAQGIHKGGLGNIALGALGGYGVGSGGAWLGGKLAPSYAGALSNFGGGSSIFNWSQPAGTANIVQGSSPLNASGYSSGYLSKIGAANAASGSNTLSQAMQGLGFGNGAANTFLSSSASPLQQALSGFGGAASTAGTTSGLFGGALSGASNMLKNANVIDIAKAGLFGKAAYDYLNPVSGSTQMQNLTSKIGQLYQQNKFTPYQVTTPYSQTGYTEDGAYVSPSQDAMNTFNDFQDLINMNATQAMNLDEQGLSQDFFEKYRALKDIQEANQMASLESRLFNRGGVHTGTAAMAGDFAARLQAGRADDMTRAIQAAFGMGTDLQNRFINAVSGQGQFVDKAFYDPMKMGVDFGRVATASDANLLNAMIDAQTADSSMSYLSDIRQRDALGDALEFGLDFLGGWV